MELTVSEWLHGYQIGIDCWHLKYQDDDETFAQWLHRVTGGDTDVAQLIINQEFLYAGRILSNRGILTRKGTYSNCYVIDPPEDNIESIFDCAKGLARTFSYGGGSGVDIGKLRPKDALVRNASKTTSGAVSFMEFYSAITGYIGQNGRRGALMISIPCTHPDLEEFIEVKSDLTKITNANISIRMTKEFMDAVKNAQEFTLSFHVDATGEDIVKVVDARALFTKLAEINWNYGEPGILFWDRIEQWNLLANTPGFKFAGTNPCAEEPLPAGGSCLLGAMNLSAFVTPQGQFNFTRFKYAVAIAVRALNDVLDEGMYRHPLAQQRETVSKWRQIGLGIMGLADMLIRMKIKYGSDDSIELCREISSVMIQTAFKTSVELGRERGSFDEFVGENIVTTPFFIENMMYMSDNCNVCDYPVDALRNSQLLTIAPTGTTSTMLGVSGGIEPLFATSYDRVTKTLHGHDQTYHIIPKIVQEYFDDIGEPVDESKLPDYFITAPEIYYEERLSMQSTWQRSIDASISSTVNLPKEFTVEDVVNLYTKAHDVGLKGITVFRRDCKRVAILTKDSAPDVVNDDDAVTVVKKTHDNVIGLKRLLTTGCGTLHCLAFFDKMTGKLVDTYLAKGSAGGCLNNMNGLSRMMSLAARGGISVDDIVDQLGSAGQCTSYTNRAVTRHDTSPGSSCPVAVAKALTAMYEEARAIVKVFGGSPVESTTKPELPKHVDTVTTMTPTEADPDVCPYCGGPIISQGKCRSCASCGIYNKCE